MMAIRSAYSGDGALHGFVDSYNSSNDALDADGVFTGEWVDVTEHDSVVVAVSTDQNGSYAVQFSPDAVNADSTITRYYRTGLINPPHRFTAARRYFRVVYTNGAVAQSYFRMQALMGVKNNLNIPLDGAVSRDYDATVVRPTSYDDEVALGLRQGHAANLKFGYNEDVSIGTEVIASFGGTFTPRSTTTTLTVVSSSTSDDGDPAGVGARTILISGINGSRVAATEVVTMNGTTNVVTTSAWLGINRVIVLSAGTSKANVGNITITATTGGAVMAYIPALASITQQLIFHVQAGHQAVIRRITINGVRFASGTQPRITVTLNVWNPGGTNAVYKMRRIKADLSVTSDLVREYTPPLLLNPTDVIWLTCTTDQNSTSIDGEIYLIEVRQSAT
jgi:hypothetical protein